MFSLKIRQLIITATIFTCVAIGGVFCQDPIFSQFYNATLQLNPALAGNTNAPTFQLNYRNQWPLIPNIYTTYSLSYDQFIIGVNSGIGVSLLADNAGGGTIKSNGINGYYSYRIKIKGDTYVKGGINVGYFIQSLDQSKLVFGDGIDPRNGPISPGGTPYPSAETTNLLPNQSFLTVGSGTILYNPNYYLGISFYNINNPNVGFLTSSEQVSSSGKLPMRLSLHGGYQIILEKGNKTTLPSFISPNLMFISQGKFNQVNIGAYMAIDKVLGGLWYRHSLFNGDAVIASVGFRKDFFKVTYSFDLTTSKLSLNQGGSHEIGITLNFDHLYPKKQNYNDCFAIFR